VTAASQPKECCRGREHGFDLSQAVIVADTDTDLAEG
jgi:hypothetical protein